MSDSFKNTIAELRSQISSKEGELIALKTTVNVLSRQIGEGDVYLDVSSFSGIQSSTAAPTQKRKLRVDEFFGRALTACVAEILEARRSSGGEGPASIDEIHQALCEGGYRFEGTSGSDENTKRGIKIALTKNTTYFVKVRDDIFGLKKWYAPKARKNGASKGAGTSATAEAEDDTYDPAGGLSDEDEPEAGQTPVVGDQNILF